MILLKDSGLLYNRKVKKKSLSHTHTPFKNISIFPNFIGYDLFKDHGPRLNKNHIEQIKNIFFFRKITKF